MGALSPYVPSPNADLKTKLEKAYRCGIDLDADDTRAMWIARERYPTIRNALVASYHTGQCERDEPWGDYDSGTDW